MLAHTHTLKYLNFIVIARQASAWHLIISQMTGVLGVGLTTEAFKNLNPVRKGLAITPHLEKIFYP